MIENWEGTFRNVPTSYEKVFVHTSGRFEAGFKFYLDLRWVFAVSSKLIPWKVAFVENKRECHNHVQDEKYRIDFAFHIVRWEGLKLAAASVPS